MIKMHTVLFCLIGLMLTGLGVGLVSFQHLRKEPDTLVSVLPKDKDVTLNHIHHVATRDGVKQWILDAESAQYEKAANKSVFKDVSATFFLKGGRTIHLTSRDGVLLTDTTDMEVSGDVVVRSGPYELNTEKLHYDHKGRSIYTDAPIFVKGEGIYLTGHSMNFYFNTEQALAGGGVEAVFENLRLL